jgi:predicted transcriptional regulator
MIRESIWVALDEDLVRALDELAKRRGVTRHEIARIALRLGADEIRRARAATEQLSLNAVARPSGCSR